ncbi:U3 small nucleolar RNA-associated protein 15 [Thelohanellus kitauei]|uniref:U3 small nucleolar RNA-associated protein 15 homolog n=1 Tax=Thelohanellus kitauei TaxID=669202 RepID=A0A0C2J3N1_THEKT|nr:U3 small nucleolar RNA-associated protein 15 [Thelohanellus kitauei]
MEDQPSVAFKKLHVVRSSVFQKPNQVRSWWKKLTNPTIYKHSDVITDMDCCPTSPYNYTCCSSNKCTTYHGATNDIIRVYTGSNEYLSVSYRSDGNLVACGSSSGYVDIYDEQHSMNHPLRTIKAHKSGVHVVKFSTDRTQLVTGCGEGWLKLWDIASSKSLSTSHLHTQRVKCASVFGNNPSIFITGSYDHNIRMIDWRTKDVVTLTIAHETPVENLALHSNGLLLLSCGGTFVNVWDLNMNASCVHRINAHSKTVTSLAFSHSCSYFHSSGLDSNIKSYNMQTFEKLDSVRYTDPIIKICITDNDRRVMACLLNNVDNYGLLYVKSHKTAEKTTVTTNEDTLDVNKSFFKRYFHDTSEIHQIDKIRRPETVKYQPYEMFLRKFEYIKAFGYVFNKKHNLEAGIVIEVMKELMRRSALFSAMKGAYFHSIISMLSFINRNIMKPQHTIFLVKLTNFYLDHRRKLPNLENGLQNHENFIKYSAELEKLMKILNLEMKCFKPTFEILGALDLIENISMIPQAIQNGHQLDQ